MRSGRSTMAPGGLNDSLGGRMSQVYCFVVISVVWLHLMTEQHVCSEDPDSCIRQCTADALVKMTAGCCRPGK
jgi:hypothetical protein